MSARIHTRAEWHDARRRRAQRGKAPRLAVERGILLRQAPDGRWIAAIQEKRFGVWRKPEHLCVGTTFEQARTVAITTWERLRLPFYWARAGERLRAYHVAAYMPRAVGA